jgi:hypothetical protein
MAGEVRQPIDIPSLERYIDQHVSEIKTPLDVKQASLAQPSNSTITNLYVSVVRFRSIEPYIPAYCRRWKASRAAQEAPRQAALKDSPQGRARVQDYPSTRRHRCTSPQGVLPLRGQQRDRDALLHHGVP